MAGNGGGDLREYLKKNDFTDTTITSITENGFKDKDKFVELLNENIIEKFKLNMMEECFLKKLIKKEGERTYNLHVCS